MMRIFTPLVLALPLVTSSALAQEPRFRDLTVQQANVYHSPTPLYGGLQEVSHSPVPPYGGSQNTPRLSFVLDRPDASYAVGENVKFLMTLDEDGYVSVLDVGPSGRVTRLFPNEYQANPHLFANRPVEVGGSAGDKIAVSVPVGVELIKVLFCRSPVPLGPETQFQSRGPFRTLEGGARTLVRDLQVLANQSAQRDTIVYSWNVLVRTY
jgi:hypothetical protein